MLEYILLIFEYFIISHIICIGVCVRVCVYVSVQVSANSPKVKVIGSTHSSYYRQLSAAQHRHRESNSGPLKGQYILLTSESSLQFPVFSLLVSADKGRKGEKEPGIGVGPVKLQCLQTWLITSVPLITFPNSLMNIFTFGCSNESLETARKGWWFSF